MNRLKRLLLAAVPALVLTAGPLPAAAEAPMAKTQAPGYHRFMVGDIEVTTVSDGTIKLPVLQLLRGNPVQLAKALKRGFLGEQVETSVNAYLVNTGSKLVLIDAGAGTLFGPTVGKLLTNLRAAGYQPEQVDEVYITHLHGDHVGGIAANGQRAFPNAVLRLDKRDADFWLSEANMNAAPAEMKPFFQGAMMSVKPYSDAGKLKVFDGSTELVPGVRAVAAHGHTPGHTTYAVESKGQKLMLWGDLMHVAAVQFEQPAVTIQFDTDSSAAAKQRMQAYKDAAKNGWMVGASHLSFPGVGHLRPAAGKGYVYVPLNYSSLNP
jgi:glyoxylase-like metal-dependent hydrolase (beta-lactamase superfamily II)